MPEAEITQDTITIVGHHLSDEDIRKRIQEGKHNFLAMDLQGALLNKLGPVENLNFAKANLTNADCRTEFNYTTLDPTEAFADTYIHGAAFCGAKNGNLRHLLARSIVSPKEYKPHVHFEALDSKTQHWIADKTLPTQDETFRALINEYLQENSKLLPFALFSVKGRYTTLVSLYMRNNPDGTLSEFIDYLKTSGATLDPTKPLFILLEFVHEWHTVRQESPVNKLLPPMTSGSQDQPVGKPPATHLLVWMVACDFWQRIMDKIKNWLAVEPTEPDEEG